MMQIAKESLPGKKVKLTITIPKEDLRPYLEEAARKISEERPVEGFRPGHATPDVLARQIGSMPLYEAAVEPMIRGTYPLVLSQEGINAVGAPEISVRTLAPGNDVVYEATVSLMPEIQKLADWKSMRKKGRPVAVTDKDVDKVIEDLRRVRTKEVRAVSGKAAEKKDKVIMDLTLSKERVPLEGGVAKRSILFLSEDGYLPGLAETVIGMKEGETKTTSLTFPKEHYQKHLAGSLVDVEITLHELYHLEPPALDDAFAVSVGLKDVQELRERVNKNLGDEREGEEKWRQEREMLEEIAKESSSDEIPDPLVEEELQKMIRELRENVTREGMEFQAYLKAVKKTPEELLAEMRPQAVLRIQVALLLRTIASQEHVVVSEEETDQEIDKVAKGVTDKETRDQIFSPAFRQYQQTILGNRKTIDLLRAAIYR